MTEVNIVKLKNNLLGHKSSFEIDRKYGLPGNFRQILASLPLTDLCSQVAFIRQTCDLFCQNVRNPSPIIRKLRMANVNSEL